MDNSVRIQAYIFLTVFYGGLIIGFIYDIYRAFRYCLKPTKVGTFIGDFIFWIISVIVTFYILLRSNWGELRGYIFIGLFLGVYIYLKTLSKIIYFLLIKIIKIISMIFDKVFNIVLYPFTLIKKMLTPGVNKLKKVNKVSKKTLKDMGKYIKIIYKKK